MNCSYQERAMFSSNLASGNRSICRLLTDRQLSGSRISSRPTLVDFQSQENGGGCILNNPGLVGSPAFACQYSKVYNEGKFLAMADEEGFISIVDTAAELPRSTADDDEPKPRAQWMAHRNAVFDIAWAKNDSLMLAASGDQTISLWDTGLAEQLGTFRSHTGSVKSICPQPGCHDVFASGARDGVLMVWDARVPAVGQGAGEACHKPVVQLQDAHALMEARRRGRRTPVQGRTKPSVTSVLFSNPSTLATGGVDGVLKLWDLRQTATPVARQSPRAHLDPLSSVPLPSVGVKQHGITSLALHPNGVELLVSLTGGHHLMYQTHRPHIGPTKLFSGHTVASFYVKAAFSPDGTHILSGSTDRKAYIWQVDGAAGAAPITLSGHEGEVTAVAWCGTDLEQIATTADDASLRVWTVRRRDQAVKEVRDGYRPAAWRDHRRVSPSPPPTSVAPPKEAQQLSGRVHPPRLSASDYPPTEHPPAPALPISQPVTPQVPTSRRTPATARPPCPSQAAPGGVDAENVPCNQQHQQFDRCGVGGLQQASSHCQGITPLEKREGKHPLPPCSGTGISSGWRPRSVADLQAAWGSHQKPRKTRQQSIATFLSPPPPLLSGTLGAACAAAAEEAGMPMGGEAVEHPGQGGGQGAAPASDGQQRDRTTTSSSSGARLSSPSSGGSGAREGRLRKMPLSPRLCKRLRVSFEVGQSGATPSRPSSTPSVREGGGCEVGTTQPIPGGRLSGVARGQVPPLEGVHPAWGCPLNSYGGAPGKGAPDAVRVGGQGGMAGGTLPGGPQEVRSGGPIAELAAVPSLLEPSPHNPPLSCLFHPDRNPQAGGVSGLAAAAGSREGGAGVGVGCSASRQPVLESYVLEVDGPARRDGKGVGGRGSQPARSVG